MQDCGPRKIGNDGTHSLGPPRQGCGQFVDISFAGEEGGETGYQPLGWCQEWSLGGQSAATFGIVCFFLLWLVGLGSRERGQASEESLRWDEGCKVGRE